MSEIVVRPMTLADTQAVIAIDQQVFSLPWAPRAFGDELRREESHFFVADDSGKVVGYLGVWFIVDEAHIATIGVHPDYTNQGVGRRLLTHALRHARGLGAVTAMLEVREHNLPALALYKHFRFEEVGRRKGYYTDTGEAALLMTAAPIWLPGEP